MPLPHQEVKRTKKKTVVSSQDSDFKGNKKDSPQETSLEASYFVLGILDVEAFSLCSVSRL